MESIAKANNADEDRLLRLIAKHPKASLTELATMMGWLLPGSRPNKPKAQRMSNALVRAKMVTKGFQGKLRLTKDGERAIADTAETP
jgi:DNA-binding IclR family transcriptional regulator